MQSIICIIYIDDVYRFFKEALTMEMYQLEYVLALEKYMHFSRASEMINVSQPTLSHGIKKLEQELGIDLFIRSTRSVQLTAAGEEFVVYAKRILSEINNAKNAMSAHTNLNKGNIRIGAIPTICYLGITSIISAFQKAYPGINMEIFEEDSSDLLKKISKSELDVAFINSANISEDGFDIYPLINDKMVLLLSINHGLAKKNRVDLSKLAKEKFLIVTGLKDDFIEACRLADFEPDIVLSSIQSPTIKELVEQGLGIAPFTSRVASALLNANMKIVHFTPVIKRKIALAVVKNNNTITTKAFSDFVLKNVTIV
jgi:LysR family transcriptional activator of glutamate synthase operon